MKRRRCAVSIRPKRDLFDELERELRSKVSDGAIAGAMTAVRIILKARAKRHDT